MRWMWIDRIVELEKGRRCRAVKNVSMSEEHLHDHFPATAERGALPVMPASLIIEGMAQTAGILVGHARDFQEKVILAKIGKATFDRDIFPGQTLIYTATLDRIDESGASAHGTIEILEHPALSAPGSSKPDAAAEPREAKASGSVPVGSIDLMFSHIDKNMRGLGFPEHNFVFTDQFFDLLRNSGFLPPSNKPGP